MNAWPRTGQAAATLLAGTIALVAAEARAIEIQEVVSPRGILAWLVEEPSVPLIAMSFAFTGGATEDPPGRPGVANLLSRILDEGAGELDSAAFQARLDDLAIDLSFSTGRDTFNGSLQTLVENRDDAAELLRLALTAPRFDAEPFARVRDQVAAGIRRGERNPGAVAGTALSETLFPGHPYGLPVDGTLDSVAAVDVADLRDYRNKVFARDNLTIAVVGAIDRAALGAMLDTIFAALPVKADLAGARDVTPSSGGVIDIDMAVPQTTIRFAMPGPKRDDPDFVAASIAAHILGGGGAGARLFDEVRSRRGLAYSIGLGLTPLDRAGLVAGGTSTRADQADAIVDIVRDEIRRFAREGPDDEELAAARSYLIGSYPLRFTTSSRIAGQLLRIQLDGLGIDYVERRNGEIAAVTLDEARRAARRLFGGGEITVVRVGPPTG